MIDELIGQSIKSVVFEMHRAAKMGYLFMDESSSDEMHVCHSLFCFLLLVVWLIFYGIQFVCCWFICNIGWTVAPACAF